MFMLHFEGWTSPLTFAVTAAGAYAFCAAVHTSSSACKQDFDTGAKKGV